MTENFSSSLADELFEVNSVKVPYFGASYREIDDAIATGLYNNPKLKMVIRGLDMMKLMDDAEEMRFDMGEYPTYLYDDNPFNDVKYLLNKEVIFNRVYPMVVYSKKNGFDAGITSFDEYSNWNDEYEYGIEYIFPNGRQTVTAGEPVHLTEEERKMEDDNISLNVTQLASEYPGVDFYYFLTPYSVYWWGEKVTDGTIYKQVEAEEEAIRLILEQDNIHLYSFNTREDIIANPDNYKDNHHYGEWINDLILTEMKNDECRLTKENYSDYIEKELEFLTTFDYNK